MLAFFDGLCYAVIQYMPQQEKAEEFKTCSPFRLSKHQKGGTGMEKDMVLRELFHRLAEAYVMDPGTADRILRQILAMLFPDLSETNFEREEEKE